MRTRGIGRAEVEEEDEEDEDEAVEDEDEDHRVLGIFARCSEVVERGSRGV